MSDIQTLLQDLNALHHHINEVYAECMQSGDDVYIDYLNDQDYHITDQIIWCMQHPTG